jgi:hypothetical protein
MNQTAPPSQQQQTSRYKKKGFFIRFFLFRFSVYDRESNDE